jgi:hypothetical protein
MCKICAFFEGGMDYDKLCDKPIDELFSIIDCANQISKTRQAEMKRGK